MNYLDILLQVLAVISQVAQALSTAEADVLPVMQSVWTDLQAAYASIVSAFQGGTTLTDAQLADVNAKVANAQITLQGLKKS